MSTTETLNNHYAAQGLRARLDANLKEVGLSEGHIDWMKLIQLDQFHTRGLMASKELAEALNPQPGDSLLDLGSGLGGPARFVAATRSVNVTGIELTPIYVDIASYLSERCGLSEKTRFVQGDAVALPFEDSSFDFAWTQHVSMNIEDKATFFAGAYRVLKPGGKFAIYDVAKGVNNPVLYPAPWSPVPEFSFLSAPEETAQQLKAAGFAELSFEDATAEALDWLKEIQSTVSDPSAPKLINLPEVLGPQVGPMLCNMAQNFLEGRTRIVRAVVQKA